jgi:hypothetical protein
MSTIKSSTTTTTAYSVEADTTGALVIQTGVTPTTAVTVGSDQSVTFAQAANLPNTFGFKNRIINGAMVIDQRNAGASVTPADANYTLDRFIYNATQSSKVTIQQNAGSVTTQAGFPNYLGVTSSSAYTVLSSDFFTIGQRIEGFNTADLAWGTASAATVTLSFWVRSSLTGTFGGAVTNSALNRSYPFTYTISSADTWEQKSITIAGDTSGTWIGATNGIGMRLYIGLGVGSTYAGTAGAWTGTSNILGATGAVNVVSTSGATFYITGVQLEKGSTATSFDYRPYGTELALCQRYYEKSFEIGTVPASAGSAAGAFEFAQQVAASAQQYGPSCKYAVVKRGTPTATFYNWNAAGNQAVNVVTAGTTTSLALRAGQSGTSSFSITFIAPTGTSVGQGLSVQWTADSEL